MKTNTAPRCLLFIVTAILLVPLVGISAWLVVLLSHPVFPARPGEDAIVFETGRETGQQIYIMHADGTNQTRLTYKTNLLDLFPFGDLSVNTQPAAAPDGVGVVFLSSIAGDFLFYRINIDGSDKKALPTPTPGNVNATLSPNGQQVAFIQLDGSLAVTNVDRTGQTCVTCTLKGVVFSPAWSPDGQALTFSLRQTKGSAIYRVNRDGSNLMQLSPSSHPTNATPSWSPDGRQIAFASDQNGTFNIYVMQSDGSSLTHLTNYVPPPGIAAGNDTPSWSPDGSQIAFVSTCDGPSEIYVMHADGTGQKRLTYTGQNLNPAWIHIP